MAKNNSFDYIIAGAGASGLSLAFHLNQAGLTHKRILLIDRAPKILNDRTWCFWERGDNAFEKLVFRKWHTLKVESEGWAKTFDIAPYTYKMLRGIDFYNFMRTWLAQQPNITQVFAEVERFEEMPNGAQVWAGGVAYQASWVFNSAVRPAALNSTAPDNRYRHLLQHFKGWVIETEHPHFDPNVATLMDFCVPQQMDDTRFVYTMPLNERKALVEFTVFGKQVLSDDAYRQQLRAYVSNRLKLDEYVIHEEEGGVIPMTDAPIPAQHSPHVINLGTAGGRTKPSTGYTFVRIQQHSQAIANALRQNKPLLINNSARQFQFYDSTLLNVLASQRRAGATVFTELYQRNPPQRIFKFLNEETNLLEDVQLMASTHIPTFLRGALGI